MRQVIVVTCTVAAINSNSLTCLSYSPEVNERKLQLVQLLSNRKSSVLKTSVWEIKKGRVFLWLLPQLPNKRLLTEIFAISTIFTRHFNWITVACLLYTSPWTSHYNGSNNGSEQAFSSKPVISVTARTIPRAAVLGNESSCWPIGLKI